jgi:hypothetical protein
VQFTADLLQRRDADLSAYPKKHCPHAPGEWLRARAPSLPGALSGVTPLEGPAIPAPTDPQIRQ